MTDVVRARLLNVRTTAELVNRWIGLLVAAADLGAGNCVHDPNIMCPEYCSRCVARRELATILERVKGDDYLRRDRVLSVIDRHIEHFLSEWGTSKRVDLAAMRDDIAKKGS